MGIFSFHFYYVCRCTDIIKRNFRLVSCRRLKEVNIDWWFWQNDVLYAFSLWQSYAYFFQVYVKIVNSWIKLMNTSQKAMFYNTFFHCFLVFSLLEIDVSSGGVNTRRMFSSMCTFMYTDHSASFVGNWCISWSTLKNTLAILNVYSSDFSMEAWNFVT